jgi:hypothetical protein
MEIKNYQEGKCKRREFSENYMIFPKFKCHCYFGEEEGKRNSKEFITYERSQFSDF